MEGAGPVSAQRGDCANPRQPVTFDGSEGTRPPHPIVKRFDQKQ